MDKTDPAITVGPGITASGTGSSTGAFAAARADFLIDNNMGLTINGETGKIEDLIDVHKALQVVMTSCARFFSPVVSRMVFRASRVNPSLGAPSIR
jgi:hypothetical protein